MLTYNYFIRKNLCAVQPKERYTFLKACKMYGSEEIVNETMF